MFRLAQTFGNTTSGANAQRGFPAPGDGAQTTGAAKPQPGNVFWSPRRETKGKRTFSDVFSQRGFASPESDAQRRTLASMPNVPTIYGQNMPVVTPYYDRGAAAVVQNYGKVLTNPIGAGIVALNRPQASYGQSAQYINGSIWWTSQTAPTSINFQGLSDPDALLAVLGTINIQAVLPGAQ